jgi:O-antigen ligase
MTIIKTLIGFGITVIPFLMFSGYDTRQPKMVLALIVSFLVSLSAFFFGLFKPVKNIFAIFLMAFLVINIYLAPKINLLFFGIPIINPWVWETGAKILVFFLFYCVMSSIDLDKHDRNLFVSAMVWCGFILSVYALFQFIGADQFGRMRDGNPLFNSSVNICASLGQRTLFSSFVAMIIPFTIYQKRWAFGLVMFLALYLSDSQVAWMATIVSVIVYFSLKNKVLFVLGALLFLFCVSAVIYSPFSKNPSLMRITDTSGRTYVWDRVLESTTRPLDGSQKSYPATGMGIGSFQYLVYEHIPELKGFQGNVRWIEAHNEYIEWLYTSGVIGLVLMLLVIVWIVKSSFIPWTGLFSLEPERRALLASFICICVCAFGTFVWHLGSHIFYTLVIAGLLSKPKGDLT